MKSKITFAIIIFSVMFAFTTKASAPTGDTNRMDSKGQKQGLWVENLGPTKWMGMYMDGKRKVSGSAITAMEL